LTLLLQSAADRNGYEYLARLYPWLVDVAFWSTILFCAFHAFRRADHTQASTRPKANYIFNQRLFHWGNFLLFALLIFTGNYLYLRRPPFADFWGFSWLTVHEWTGLLFILGIFVHAIAARFRGDWESMRPALSDWSKLRDVWRNFPSQSANDESGSRYNAAQKMYHHLLALLAILFTVSGVTMWMSASRTYLFARGMMHWMRITHDVSAITLVVMVIGHIYFSLLKANRKHLKDMAGWPEKVSAPDASANTPATSAQTAQGDD